MTIPESARWVPSEYVEDINPMPRAQPQDWVQQGSLHGLNPAGGEPAWPCLADGNPMSDDDEQGRPLRPGERVDFDWIVVIGTWAWTGTGWEPPLPPIVPGSSGWQVANEGDILLVDEVTPEDNDPFEANLYCWCRQSVPFRFTDGTFVQVQGTPCP